MYGSGLLHLQKYKRKYKEKILHSKLTFKFIVWLVPFYSLVKKYQYKVLHFPPMFLCHQGLGVNGCFTVWGRYWEYPHKEFSWLGLYNQQTCKLAPQIGFVHHSVEEMWSWMHKHALCITVKLSFLEVNFFAAKRKSSLEVSFMFFLSVYELCWLITFNDN